VALTRCELEQVSWRALESLAARHHAWETVFRKLLTAYAQRKEQREFEFLTMNAAERWRRLHAPPGRAWSSTCLKPSWPP
jgi:hypothetical protein